MNTDTIGGFTLLSLVHVISKTPGGRNSWIASGCIVAQWMTTGEIYQAEGETMQAAVDAAAVLAYQSNRIHKSR